MLVRMFGDGLFVFGLMGTLGLTFVPGQALSADPVDRLSGFVFFGLAIATGLCIRRRGTPQPIPAPPRRDWDVELEADPRRAATGGRDTGSCGKCGYRPVAYDADYCPSCAARHPNPGVVNRTVGKAVPLGGLACGLLGAVWAYFDMGDGGPGSAVAGLVIGGVAGVILGLAGGLVGGGLARLSGVR